MVGLHASLVALLMASCSTAPLVPAGTAPATAEPTAALDAAMVDWIEFRTAVGLRADEAWVREVAANPASKVGSDAYEIPLLPDEVAFLEGRMQRIDDAKAFGESYAAEFPDGFAGAAIDSKRGDRLVLLYTKDVEIHQARLAVLAPAVRPEVRRATWTLEELTQFRSRIQADGTEDPRIKVYVPQVDILANRVLLDYRSDTRGLGDTLLSRFSSTGWLVVRWYGRLHPWDGPVGAIRLRVVDADGDPMVDFPCQFGTLNPDLGVEGGGGSTDSSGECLFEDLPIGPWEVTVLGRDEQVQRVLTSVETEVRAETTTVVRVQIPE